LKCKNEKVYLSEDDAIKNKVSILNNVNKEGVIEFLLKMKNVFENLEK